MTRPSHALRLAAVLVVAALLPAACASSPPSATAPGAPFNQSLHDQLPRSVRDRGVLRVETDAAYAPMESEGPDGRTIVGMDPDLGVALARVLGVRLDFTTTAFTRLLTDVAGGQVDIAISAVTDTPERAKTVDFVNYFSAGTSIVVQRGNPAGVTGISDLCGRIVAVKAGTVQDSLLTRAQTNCGGRPMTVHTYPDNTQALAELSAGRAVAVLNDFPVAVALVNDTRTNQSYQLASTTQYEPGLYGIVVPKDQPGLRDALQGACEELVASGVYTEILARWGVRDGAITRITINSGR